MTAVGKVRSHVTPLGLHNRRRRPRGWPRLLKGPPKLLVGDVEEVGVSDSQVAAERGVGVASRVEAQGVGFVGDVAAGEAFPQLPDQHGVRPLG